MKKLLTLAAAILLLAVIGLSLASCGGSKAETTYKILTHTDVDGAQMELKLSSGSFTMTSTFSSESDGVPYTMIQVARGNATTSGDTVTCTLTELEARYEFATEEDKQAALASLEKYKEYYDEDYYNQTLSSMNGGYTKKISEATTEENLPAEYVFKLNETSKTAVALTAKATDGSTVTLTYHDESKGNIKEQTTVFTDGTSRTVKYDEDGNPINDY